MIKIAKVKPWKLPKFGFTWNLLKKANMNKVKEKQESIVPAHLFAEWMNEWGSRNWINYIYIFITYKVSSNKLCMYPLHPKKNPLKN